MMYDVAADTRLDPRLKAILAGIPVDPRATSTAARRCWPKRTLSLLFNPFGSLIRDFAGLPACCRDSRRPPRHCRFLSMELDGEGGGRGVQYGLAAGRGPGRPG
jgi:hypothetical protein